MSEVKLLEVKLLADRKVVCETLSRLGVANRKSKVLFPSCYLYSKDNKDYICHFKELFLLTRESAYNNLSNSDIERKNAIIFNLKNWGLIDIDDALIDPHKIFIYVLPYIEKHEWNISHKINMRYLNNM